MYTQDEFQEIMWNEKKQDGKIPWLGNQDPTSWQEGRQGRKKDIEDYTECDFIYFKNLLYLYLYICIHNLYKHLSINDCVCTDSRLLLEGYIKDNNGYL